MDCKINEYALNETSWIADPFLGTGTTSVSAKMNGVNSIGIEAHPFVYWVAKNKLLMQYDVEVLHSDVQTVIGEAQVLFDKGVQCKDVWPDLVYKCFRDEVLNQLFTLRTAIEQIDSVDSRRDFLKIALTATLRDVTSAGAGWPYIAPSKYAERTVQRDAFEDFATRCAMMLDDVCLPSFRDLPATEHKLINGDARQLTQYARPASVDLILTSPPYLNNYDYADRTRLETYFWGIYNSWGQISKHVRDHLLVAATTQIRRTAMENVRNCPGVESVSPKLHRELIGIIQRLEEIRKIKRGRKSYDLMVAGYFEDMLKVIKGAYILLRKGKPFVLVLGDSAPYGNHVRTDEIIGELAVAVGFSEYSVEVIRARGEKWAGNSQRHQLPLRESIVTIVK